jgi:homoserine O-acetyltransferase
MNDANEYVIPAFTTQAGITLDVRIVYKTFGTLNADRDNVVVLPTFYGGRHNDTEYFLAPGRVIDPEKYFVVIPNMFGNGMSSSPSNTPLPHGRGAFPLMSLYDNVRAQHELVTTGLGVRRVRLVVGYSMGAMQACQWGALYPQLVDAIAPICGSAKTSPHNQLMLDGPVSALQTDAAFNDGWYDQAPIRGLLAFGRVYASWFFSQKFFRDALYREIGLSSIEDVVRMTQRYFLQSDANDLIAMANTWRAGDISANPEFNGDFAAALGAITARAIVMPGETDLYFRVADSALEVAQMPGAELRPIPSSWGHTAGFGINPPDNEFIDKALKELLT